MDLKSDHVVWVIKPSCSRRFSAFADIGSSGGKGLAKGTRGIAWSGSLADVNLRKLAESNTVVHKIAAYEPGAPRRWTVALPILVLAAYFASLMVRFAYKGNLYLSFFVDDFFYYVIVAKNLALHGASTFNGLQSTNGYHPFWLLTITSLYRIFGGQRSFFVALVLVIWLLVCGSYLALRRAQVSLAMEPDAGLACALISITFMAVLSRSGMEVSLALFCLSLFWVRMAAQNLESQTPREGVISGFLASALVLSRIDTSLVVATYCALTVLWPAGSRRQAGRQILWFAVGLLPVAAYIAINQIEFGTILPVSGVVKNLKDTWLPSASAVSILCLPRLINIVFTWPSFAVCALYFLHRLLKSSQQPSRPKSAALVGQRRVQLCVALHPIILYSILSFSSDWPMWWIWYLYPLVPVWALLGPTLMQRWLPLPRAAMLWLAGAVACGSLAIFMERVNTNKPAVFALERAGMLRQFALDHPGRYGIGDAAGMPTYLMQVPVVQLEGLMGDKPFLDRIRRQEPLLEAMVQMGIDYYVTVRPEPSGDCYDVREPAQAGPHSPVMKAHICLQPSADIRPPGDPHHALVFDVRQLRQGASAATSGTN
jgi:hypothetical protein